MTTELMTKIGKRIFMIIRRPSLLLSSAVILYVPLVSCSSTDLVTVDYAKNYDFSAVESYQYLNTERTNAESPQLDFVIRESIRRELSNDGLIETRKGGDLMVTYHIVKDEAFVVRTPEDHDGAYSGWGPGWSRWGYEGPSKSWRRWRYTGPSLPTVRDYEATYPKDTLILDAFDPGTKRLLWRGVGKLSTEGNPTQLAEQTTQTIQEISNRWRWILSYNRSSRDY